MESKFLKKEVREESEFFSELAQVCSSPGYVHAIAYFCFRDNTIRYADAITPEDVLQQFSMERLARTEISTLIGLACKEKRFFEVFCGSDKETQKIEIFRGE